MGITDVISEDSLDIIGSEIHMNYDALTNQKSPEKILERELSDTILQRCGNGSGRTVYQMPDKSQVVKFATGNGKYVDGITQNTVEDQLWSYIRTQSQSRFFEVIQSSNSYTWIIMDGADAVLGEAGFSPDRGVQEITQAHPDIPPNSEFAEPENIGYDSQDKIYKILDYGSYIPRPFYANLPSDVQSTIPDKFVFQ